MVLVQQARTQPGQVRKEAAIHASTCVCHFYIMNKEDYMKIALKEAHKAKEKDEVPVGAVIVFHDEVIAKAHNLKEHKQLPTAHAEMLAIEKAAKKLGTWHLDECDLYVTLEPCMMCIGAINQARIQNVFYGTKDPKFGAVESMISYKTIKGMNRHPKTEGGILQRQCAEILTEFFKAKRLSK